MQTTPGLKNIIYIDAAATAQKPQSVINAQIDFLQNGYANAGRGICERAGMVDEMVRRTRQRVANFINAARPDQIIFTSGTTDGINRIANILQATPWIWNGGSVHITASDLDHHSARMPFEELQHKYGVQFSVTPLDDDFNIDVSNIAKADVFIITAMSNVLGAVQDVKKIIAAARAKNPKVITIVDAAQYVAHAPIDVADWDADFLCFSGHKIGADTGVGVMYIRDPENICPDKFGGAMVAKITGSLAGGDSKWTLAPAPDKFEAGTLPLTQIAGLEPAIDELVKTRGDNKLIQYLYDELSEIDRIKIITGRDSHLLTFVVNGMHVLDFGALIGANDICLRVGNMCASWMHMRLGHNDGSIRISTGFWNTMDEMKHVVRIIKKIVK